jgi:hypothetical protein
MHVAIGRFSIKGKEWEKPCAVTDLPSINDSTYACFPAQHVSAHESKPSLQPFDISVGDKEGIRGA